MIEYEVTYRRINTQTGEVLPPTQSFKFMAVDANGALDQFYERFPQTQNISAIEVTAKAT